MPVFSSFWLKLALGLRSRAENLVVKRRRSGLSSGTNNSKTTCSTFSQKVTFRPKVVVICDSETYPFMAKKKTSYAIKRRKKTKNDHFWVFMKNLFWQKIFEICISGACRYVQWKEHVKAAYACVFSQKRPFWTFWPYDPSDPCDPLGPLQTTRRRGDIVKKKVVPFELKTMSVDPAWSTYKCDVMFFRRDLAAE